MNAEAFASIWLAIIFSVLLASLIFNTKFRADFMGKDMPEKVTILGVTVEGKKVLELSPCPRQYRGRL